MESEGVGTEPIDRALLPSYGSRRVGKRLASKDEKFLQIVQFLRRDARAQLTDMAKELGIPKSTIFDYMKLVRERFEFTLKPKDTGYPYDRKPG